MSLDLQIDSVGASSQDTRAMKAPTDRYADTNALWASVTAPPITRDEAERAARRLLRKFGRKAGYPRQRSDAKLRAVRRCWIATEPGSSITRGWARLAHDVSHMIFRLRYPMLRPHNPLHSVLEYEIASYVVTESGWLEGALRPKAKSVADQHAAELARVDAAIKRWGSKLRRAQTALKKLARKRARLARRGKP
jgi:hypothetical protein